MRRVGAGIIRLRNGRCALCLGGDIGVAKIRDEPGAAATVHGAIIGTPAYMAPEQIKRSSAVDGRADMYAVGLMCYEALCGQRPFLGNQLELLAAQLTQLPEPPSVIAARRGIRRLAADWTKLDAILLKTLAKEPAQRYADCAELLAELNKAWLPANDSAISLVGLPSGAFQAASPAVPTPSPSLPATQLEGRTESVPNRQRTTRRWAAIGVAALVLGGAAAWTRLLHHPPAADPANGAIQRSPDGLPPTEAAVTPEARARARVAAAQRGSTEERRVLLEAIGAVRSRTLLPVVTALVADEHPAVWRPAVQAAALLGHPGDSELSAALTKTATRAAAAAGVEVAMARLVVGDTAARATLEAVVAGQSMDAELRLRAAVVLAQAGLAPAAALRATLRLTVASGALRQGPYRTALSQLVRMHDTETTKRLTTALKSDNPNLRGEAAEVLARAGRPDGKDALLALAQAGSGELAPALALAEAGDGRAAPLLVPRLRDGAAAVRQRVLAAIGQLAQRGATCAPSELAALLTDPDASVATTAAVAWLSAAPCAAPSTPRPAGDPATSPHDRAR